VIEVQTPTHSLMCMGFHFSITTLIPSIQRKLECLYKKNFTLLIAIKNVFYFIHKFEKLELKYKKHDNFIITGS